MFEKSDVLPHYIKYKVDVQISKLVKNDTEYSAYGHIRTYQFCPRRITFRRQMQLIPDAPESIRWSPRSRLDDFHDDAQATAGLTESDVPSLLFTYFKV